MVLGVAVLLYLAYKFLGMLANTYKDNSAVEDHPIAIIMGVIVVWAVCQMIF